MQDRRTAFRVRRAALNLTQLAAARASRIELNRFVRIETGVYDPTAAEVKALCRALKATAAELCIEQVAA